MKPSLATLNRITVALVMLSLGLAGWLAFQRLDQAPQPAQHTASATR